MPTPKIVPFAPKLRAFDGTCDSIERRFRDFLQTTRLNLRVRVQEALEDERADAVIAGHRLPGLPPYRTTELTRSDDEKIRRRVQRILKARQAASGLTLLKAEVAARFQPVLKGVELAGPANEHEADEIAARLFEDMPWHGRVLEILWRDMRQGARDGLGLRFRPLLMDGPPGAGKTTLALRLAELARVPYAYVDVATSSEGFNLSGAQRTWSTATPGKPVETILETRTANPLIVVDEIEKGSVHYSARGGVPTSAHQALLSLLEPTSARVWECPWSSLRLDLSHVNWCLTANDTHDLPAPLRSRLRIVAVRGPTHQELRAFAGRELARRGLDEDALDTVERLVGAYPEGDERLSLRTVLRIIGDLAAITQMAEVQH